MQDFAYGTLTAGVAASETTVTSAEFADLPAVSSGATYIPITLLNDLLRTHENVWITNHVLGATTATVLRGKEFTTAQDWANGTRWVCAVTLRDVPWVLSAAALPADAHTGMRAVVSDKGEVWDKTYAQGWLGSVHGNREDMGRSVDGTASPANGMSMMVRALTYAGTTSAAGILSVPLPNGGFPNRLVTAAITRASGTWFMPVIEAASTSKTALGVLCQTAAGTTLNSAGVTVGVIAIGY
jgi:hypothetical protein